MILRGKYLILSESKKPFIDKIDTILCDMTEYPTPKIKLHIDNSYYDLDSFRDFITSKLELKWRSDDVKKCMIIYYESVYRQMLNLSRDEKINRLINKELYNINNLALAC